MNQIVTITMVGQWPHGLPLHLNNMKWALGRFVHESFIVTTNEIKEEYEKQFPWVKFIGVSQKGSGFIKFWEMFPHLVRQHKIDGEFFLLMEQDIWFYEQLTCLPHDPLEIINYLPLSEYHAMTVDGEIYHHRVWEGANIIYGKIIHKALEEKMSFAFNSHYFFEKDRKKWEKNLGGKIGMRAFQASDTMDEMCYYCPMVHKTTAVFEDKAVHIRGPETIHRNHPKLYNSMTGPDVGIVKKKTPYLDFYVGMAGFFLAGNYDDIGKFDMHKMKPENKGMFKRLRHKGREWLDTATAARLEHLCNVLEKK